MSSVGHTPGPWRSDGEDVLAGHTCQATHIANVNPVKDMFRSTAEANARLIAAAPELLEVARQALFWLEGAARQKAVAAIAKATGEA